MKQRSIWLEVLLFIVAVASALFVGLSLALVAREFYSMNSLGMFLFISCVSTLFLRFSRNWGLLAFVTFDCIYVLLAYFVAIYINIAPRL